jgi:hypothetical protein
MKITKKEIFYSLGITALFIITRLAGILKIPIFTDEAIYLRWSQIASWDASQRFIPLIDGKQPLYMWVTMVVMRIINEPLLAGRLVSVFSGFGALVGIFMLTKELFNKKTAFLAAFLYVVFPLFVLYDKMALVDAMLTMFGVWSLWLAVKMAKERKLVYALLLGGTLGFAYLTKSPAVFFVILSFLSGLFIDFKKKQEVSQVVKFIALFVVAFIIAQGFYNILRLSPMMHMVARKNSTFVRSFSEVLKDPFFNFWGNLKGVGKWIINYVSIPLIVLSILGIGIKTKNKWREKLFLSFWFFGPLLAYSLFGKVLYPRYILFFTPALMIFTAHTIIQLKKHFASKIFYIGVLLVLIPNLYTSFKLITDPIDAPIPKADKGQFFNSYFAGDGVEEVVEFFKKKTKEEEVVLYTEGTFGLLPYAVELYFNTNPNIKIIGVWPLSDVPSDKVRYVEEKANYLITNETQDVPKHWPIERIFEVQKGKSTDKLRLFKIVPDETN